jgi:hypothetical protein
LSIILEPGGGCVLPTLQPVVRPPCTRCPSASGSGRSSHAATTRACDHDGKRASWEMLSNQKLLLLGRLGMAVCACACLGAACLGVQTADVGARRLPRRCARERRLHGMRAKNCMLLQLELDHFFRFQNNQSNYQTSDTVFDATRIRLSSKFPAK